MLPAGVALGELDRLITLEFKTSGQSASGEPTETWGSAESVWAKVIPLSGAEFFSALAAQLVAEEMLVFHVRYRTDIRAGVTRIKYNPGDVERIYNIRRVTEVGRRVRLEIHADSKRA